ncbi:hypothetical protein GCM10008018_45390 [Paenibacillus marchantiophytorum]|uniref:Transposon Tn7 transposition protein TnsD C-terminal domain-containing protein n=2 Tax=Paenibacillus marchantiophytorum TaxID=1619310 RepID=A0ABQ1EZP1_9BACL|nr:hypothetical protein GCM10008018_45390 [Paenibacillus marchantiophytorum]
MIYQSNCSGNEFEYDINKSKVVEFGPIWHERLESEYNQQKSIKEIAEILGANRSTIKKYLLLIEQEKNTVMRPYFKGSLEWITQLYDYYDRSKSVYETSILLKTSKKVVTRYIEERIIYESVILPTLRESAAATESEPEKLEPKTKLLKLLKNNPDLSRLGIRKAMGSKMISSLLREEGEWMNHILPPADHPFKSPYWEDEDLKLASVLTQVCESVYKTPPNKQIRRYTILNQLSVRDKARLLNHADKLPRSLELLEKSLESLEDYQIRVIPQTVQLYRKHYGNATVPMLLGTHKYKNCSQRVRICIEEYIAKN